MSQDCSITASALVHMQRHVQVSQDICPDQHFNTRYCMEPTGVSKQHIVYMTHSEMGGAGSQELEVPLVKCFTYST